VANDDTASTTNKAASAIAQAAINRVSVRRASLRRCANVQAGSAMTAAAFERQRRDPA
jgi:hypothetical protein